MAKYKLLACGSNGSYQLGTGNDTDQNTLVECVFVLDGVQTSILPIKPSKISCGGNHTLVLLQNGDVYSCGENVYGQCGHDPSDSIPFFTKIDGSDWVNIACGWENSTLINRKGEIFVCGLGNKGELGLGKALRRSKLTKLSFSIPTDEDLAKVEVKSSLNHTVIKLENSWIGWGNSRKGQLGTTEVVNGKPEGVIWKPRRLEFGEIAKDASYFDVGREFTAIGSKNSIQTFGKLQVETPLDSGTEILVQIRTMWSSVHLLVKASESGQLVVRSYGNNSHGQLYPVNSDISIEAFTVGSEHGLILGNDNKVYSWGWGEHGNCGVQKKQEAEDVTFDYLNVVYNNTARIRSIWGGCATSWLVVETVGCTTET